MPLDNNKLHLLWSFDEILCFKADKTLSQIHNFCLFPSEYQSPRSSCLQAQTTVDSNVPKLLPVTPVQSPQHTFCEILHICFNQLLCNVLFGMYNCELFINIYCCKF